MYHRVVSVGIVLAMMLWNTAYTDQGTSGDGFEDLFNGLDLDGWEPKVRKGSPGAIFARGDTGELHVYKGMPDGYQLGERKNDTFAVLFTDKRYSRYCLSLEYQWGSKRLNTFDKWGYDSGVFYHIADRGRLWPTALQYQIRFDPRNESSHTGDLMNIRKSFDFNWSSGPGNKYLPPPEGGIDSRMKSVQALPARNPGFVYKPGGGWNKVEIIVMGDDYVIHKLNGDVVNMITRLTVGQGFIGIQAESAEILFRNIRIKEFREPLPADIFL